VYADDGGNVYGGYDEQDEMHENVHGKDVRDGHVHGHRNDDGKNAGMRRNDDHDDENDARYDANF
jgi:hypothetical protein